MIPEGAKLEACNTRCLIIVRPPIPSSGLCFCHIVLNCCPFKNLTVPVIMSLFIISCGEVDIIVILVLHIMNCVEQLWTKHGPSNV